jgi:hypothetical protein
MVNHLFFTYNICLYVIDCQGEINLWQHKSTSRTQDLQSKPMYRHSRNLFAHATVALGRTMIEVYNVATNIDQVKWFDVNMCGKIVRRHEAMIQ